MDQQQQRFLYYIQEVGQQAQSKPSVLIGVLDASGSMSSYWSTLAIEYNKIKKLCGFADTITFDTRAYQKGNTEIDTNINKNGGGGTDITQAIIALNTTLQKYVDVPVTVIFVSDGAGNTSGIDKIIPPPMKFLNFICVGVGKGFPTFISMQLRQQFHKGDANVPPLFLVHNEGWQQNFATQFEMLSQYISVMDPLKTSPCFEFPWDKEAKQEFYPGQWVQSEEKFININGENVFPAQMDLTKFVDLARYWLQNVQVKSLKQDATSDAQIAYEELNRMRPQFVISKQKLTFAQRIQQNQMYEPLTVILRELKALGEQNFLKNLSPEEAAKRLVIGTQVGAYHNKAVQIRGLTVEEYLKDRDDFIKIISSVKLEPSESERSVISLQNQKEVFMENDIVAGLQLCHSQYDLVTQLPVIGYGIFVKRFNGSMINPWLIEVTQMAKHHKFIDSLAVFNGENHLKLQIGDNEIENINCICPLYTEKDKDLAPLLQSRLFHILMTFNVMQNADTCFDTAYAAVLANCLLFLINQPDSQWKTELIELIRETYQITYVGKYNFYKNELISKPATSLVTEHPDIKTKCEDPSKAILVLEMAKNDLQPEKIKEIAERIVIEAVGRVNEKQIEDYYLVKNVDNELVQQVFEKIEHDIYKNIPQNLLATFYTKQELKDFITGQFEEAKKTIKFDVQIARNEEEVRKFGQSKYNFQTLQKIYKHFVGEEFTFEFFAAAIGHACKYTASIDRSTNEISFNLAEPEELVRRKKHTELINTNKIVQNVFKKTKPILIDQFTKTHLTVLPTNLYHIQQFVQDYNLLVKFGFTLSNLLKNACLAVDCPHYLSYRPQLNQHLTLKLPIHGFHKAIKSSLKQSNEKTFNIIRSGSVLVNGLKLSKAQIDELDNKREELLVVIDRIKKEYQKIKQQ